MTHSCPVEGCGRTFIDAALLNDHADSVHTYGELNDMLRSAVREAYTPTGPGSNTCWIWIRDFTDPWVVFSLEDTNGDTLYQANYSVSGEEISFETPVEVEVRTTYVQVGGSSSANEGAALMAKKVKAKKKAC